MDLTPTGSRPSTSRTPLTTFGLPTSTPTRINNFNLIIEVESRENWKFSVNDLAQRKYYVIPTLTTEEYNTYVNRSQQCNLHSLCYKLDNEHPIVQYVNNPFAKLPSTQVNVTLS